MKNLDLAKILYNIADILELKEVPFKPQAYRRAALAIEGLTDDIAELAKQDKLREIPGVGESIAEKIEEFLKTGKVHAYEKLKKDIKIDFEQLSAIPGLGPKKMKVLYQKLGVKNLADLKKAITQHKLQTIPGFGEETEKNLLQGIQVVQSRPKRFLYAQVAPIVDDIIRKFNKYDFVQKMEIAGSFRRGKETVGDLDFLVISNQAEKVMAAFTGMAEVKEVLAQGMTKASVRLTNGLQIDLRVLHPREWGSALLYFIGSKEHNVELRKLALSKGYTLSEYGLFQLKEKGNGEKEGEKREKEGKGKKWVAGRTEEEIYKKLGVDYMDPELRENTGEIVAAQKHALPKLITVKDINGVFHNHSTWSDGSSSLLEMAQQAERLGFKFISFNDHFGQMGITNPLNEKRLPGYLAEIEKVRKKVGLRVFTGVEIDILKDGKLPLSPKKLKELDVVIASVHVAQKMSEAEMTTRVCRALEEYPVNILGHPTGRLLNVREPIALNLDTVFEVAKRRHVFLEINAQPPRMDLDGLKVKAGLQAGCQFALSTDAHAPQGLSYYPYGVLSARRGWLEKKDLLNCWSLPKIEKVMEK